MLINKNLIYIFLISLSFATSAAQKLDITSSAPVSNKNESFQYISETDSVINYGKLFLNTPYCYGACGTSTFDCSGFTSYVYRNFGYNLERSSRDQAKQFDNIDHEELKTGDLVYFASRKKSQNIGHVGIVVAKNEKGDFDFIHASVQKGVIISNSEEDYYKKRFVKANRVISDDRLLSVIPCDAIKENSIKTDEQFAERPISFPPKETEKLIPATYHKVEQGENLTVIANKYNISVAELKRRNNLKNSKITPSQRLIIENQQVVMIAEITQTIDNKSIAEISSVEKQQNSQPASHTVKKGETLFSISKLYNIPVEELKKTNQLQSNVIHFGDKLNILASAPKVEKADNKNTTQITKVEQKNYSNQQIESVHTVVHGETLFSISNKYNIAIDDIKKMNTLTNNNIRPGQKLNLTEIQNENTAATNNPKKITHKVGPGESFYSIAKNYGCTIDELKNWNSKNDNKLNKGDMLIVYPKTI